MPKFTEALLKATYEKGKPGGRLTEEHERAEHHRFKKDFLFKTKAIPKAIYASRLIQHYLIIKNLETQLNKLSQEEQQPISAFFALSYLEHLWRTAAIEKDLQQLGVNPGKIQSDDITKATQKYLQKIESAKPLELLTHFMVHVAGFMHGGIIIQNKYIKPSNALTTYQISTYQYDFSEATHSVLDGGSGSVMDLYQDMTSWLDSQLLLHPAEYESVLEQAKSVYEEMTSIYDDLCRMHSHQPLISPSLAVIGVSLVAFAWVLKLLFDLFNPLENNHSSSSKL